MGIHNFLPFVRSLSPALVQSVPAHAFARSIVTIDANNYFYKFLNTESECGAQLETHFLALSANLDVRLQALITEALSKCSTSSERHLLMCLYVFSEYCRRKLAVRQMLYVIDGAAPKLKSAELVDRARQKRSLNGTVLNDKRSLLLHRIFVLRWYQVLALSLALVDTTVAARQQPPTHDRRHHRSSQATHNDNYVGVPHLALFRMLQTSFEWALGSQIPESLFARSASKTFLARLPVHQIIQLMNIMINIRVTVQASFVVELDWLSFPDSLVGIEAQLCSLIDAMIASDNIAAITCRDNPACKEQKFAGQSSSQSQSTPQSTPPPQSQSQHRPFIVCVHVGSDHAQTVRRVCDQRAGDIERCWRNCRATFLVCAVLHTNHSPDPRLCSTLSDETSTAEFILPSAFGNIGVARETFENWHCVSGDFWQNKSIFEHQHKHMWRHMDYASWLCSEKSASWLHDGVVPAHGQSTNADMCAAVKTPRQKTATFYRCAQVGARQPQKPFAEAYDTKTDASHQNLRWTAHVRRLFEQSPEPQLWQSAPPPPPPPPPSDTGVAADMLLQSSTTISTCDERLMSGLGTDFLKSGSSGSSGGGGGGGACVGGDQCLSPLLSSCGLCDYSVSDCAAVSPLQLRASGTAILHRRLSQSCGSSSNDESGARCSCVAIALWQFSDRFFMRSSDNELLRRSNDTESAKVVESCNTASETGRRPKRTRGEDSDKPNCDSASLQHRHKRRQMQCFLHAQEDSVGASNICALPNTLTTARAFGEARRKDQHWHSNLEERDRHRIRQRITDEFLQIAVRFLRTACGAHVLVAEHEAEATCAKLCRDSVASFLFSDDVDALAFGAPHIVLDVPNIVQLSAALASDVGVTTRAFASLLTQQSILERFDITAEQMVLWHTLCGSDFSALNRPNKWSAAARGGKYGPIKQTLALVHRCDALQHTEDLLRWLTQQYDASKGRLLLDTHVFFLANHREEQQQFLCRQFAPWCADETKNLHNICLTRKTAFSAAHR